MINPDHYTLAILIMAMITFSVRYVFFTTSFQIKLTPQIKNILTFTAPCVLTAMLIPIMFQDVLTVLGGASGHANIEMVEVVPSINTSVIGSLLSSSYFWASMFAIVSSLFIRKTLLVILLSMAVFYGLRWFVFV